MNSYVGGMGASNISFSGTSAQFSIEAWANGGPSQIDGAAVVVKGSGNNGANSSEQFAIAVSGDYYRFYVTDPKSDIYEADASSGPDGAWQHLVGVCDGTTLTLYINGAVAGTAATPSLGVRTSTDPVSIGAERSGPTPTYDWAYSGTIGQVAIYPYALTGGQVAAHYAAAYGSNLAPFIVLQPLSVTNYYSLPGILSVAAAGTVPLSYQWTKEGSGPVAGATASVFEITNLDYADAGTYTVSITNTINGTNAGIVSQPVTITVLPPPTNALEIPDLVMHLTFDNTLADATGRGNDATNEASGGALLMTNDYVPGLIGQAFYYQTTVTSTFTNANYASIGWRPDLQFGSGNFTVSMWVQLPANYVGNDLPFFCDVTNSTYGHPGYCFEPSFGTTEGSTLGWPGGWGFSVYSETDAGEGVYGDVGTINDGSWHNLVYVIDQTVGATVYLDGVPSHQNRQEGTSVIGIGNIDSSAPATIGQDPTGLYGQPSSSSGSAGSTIAIDELGVWRRALTPLEAASIYAAAHFNKVSYNYVPIFFSYSNQPGQVLHLTWNEGKLQSSSSLLGPWTTLTNASPLTLSATNAAQMFFRVSF